MVVKKAILPLALVVALVSCGPETETVTKAGTGTTVDKIEVISDYGQISRNSQSWCKKIQVDGHEYLVFGSGLANPPTVIHNMACPCMSKDIINYN